MQASHQERENKNERTELEGRYGRIGIPAVAAALPYHSCSRNPAYAPAAVKRHDDSDDSTD